MQPSLRNAVLLSVLAVLLVLDPSRPAAAEVRTIQIYSATNRRQTTFAVYLPPHYAKDERTRYPVVYSLHGLSGDPTRRTGQIVPALEAALSTGAVAPMIWVFPDGQRNSFYGDSHDGHKQVYSNIVAEVIPYVDRQFRTRPDRASRAIEGFSMGGYGAAMLGAKHPELFGAVVVYAGAFAGWENFQPDSKAEMYDGNREHFLPYSAWEMSHRNAKELRERVAYLIVVGDQDPEFQNTLRFRDYLATLDVHPEFVVLAGYGHNGRAYADEGTGFRFLSKFFERSTVR